MLIRVLDPIPDTKEEIFMTLGLCMIVRNEEEVLARCLNSVKDLTDEIVVVDTGSDDATRDIAGKYTDKVYPYRWNFDFAAARNYAFSLSSADYILWLDADDVLLEKDRCALSELKKKLDGSVNAYYLRYDAAFDEAGNVTMYFFRERIVKRACSFVWQGRVHETLCVSPPERYEPGIAVTHKKGTRKEHGRNLFIFARMFADGTMPDDRQKYYFARELCDNGLYETAATAFEWFLRGSGWAEDKIGACRALALCYKTAGARQKQLSALLKTFDFAPPRPEICCDLGDFYREERNYSQAVFWYKLALNEKTQAGNGFVCPDYRGFIPCLWLCVCFDKLGDLSRAKHYNELAGKIKPQDPSYLHNKRYFDKIFNDEEKL